MANIFEEFTHCMSIVGKVGRFAHLLYATMHAIPNSENFCLSFYLLVFMCDSNSVKTFHSTFLAKLFSFRLSLGEYMTKNTLPQIFGTSTSSTSVARQLLYNFFDSIGQFIRAKSKQCARKAST